MIEIIVVLPTEVVKFLKNPNLFKSGVNIRGDGLKLHRDFNVLTNGLVELMIMTQHIDSPLLLETHRRSLSALTSLFVSSLYQILYKNNERSKTYHHHHNFFSSKETCLNLKAFD